MCVEHHFRATLQWLRYFVLGGGLALPQRDEHLLKIIQMGSGTRSAVKGMPKVNLVESAKPWFREDEADVDMLRPKKARDTKASVGISQVLGK